HKGQKRRKISYVFVISVALREEISEPCELCVIFAFFVLKNSLAQIVNIYGWVLIRYLQGGENNYAE
ncbi:hypothetical protein COZ13_01900, partial [Candidatus Desantisbacteria bacterium CG_4_10_14_3_um_filter_40_18]